VQDFFLKRGATSFDCADGFDRAPGSDMELGDESSDWRECVGSGLGVEPVVM
jgi:hypothetical protein